MAFDFVSYITQQVEQQHPNLFAEEGKAKKLAFITHLISLQLAKLIELQQKDSEQAYQFIQSRDHEWLSRKTQQHAIHDDFYQPIQPKLADANTRIATTLLSELDQLDQNASLGQPGIQELLDGQYHWMQNQVQDWFWDSIGQPQYKLAEPKTDDQAEFQQVMKEFSQIIQQQAQQVEHTHARLQPEQPIAIPVGLFYVILNPVIAAAILIGLYQAVL